MRATAVTRPAGVTRKAGAVARPMKRLPATAVTRPAGVKRKAGAVAKNQQGGSSAHDKAQGDKVEYDCDVLAGRRRVFANFAAACQHYAFPGSHQVGSYGPKGEGIVRTYSNATPGKDIVLDNGEYFLYRLKDEKVRAQFEVNARHNRPVRIFRKVSSGVLELGLFKVKGFCMAGRDDQAPKFGKEFVRFAIIEY